MIKARPTNKVLIKKRFPKAYAWLSKYGVWRDDYGLSFKHAKNPYFNDRKNIMVIPKYVKENMSDVLVHEMGHVWQANDPRILALEKLYLSKVARYSSQPVAVHDIRHDERLNKVFFKRKPIDEYIEKIYMKPREERNSEGGQEVYWMFPRLRYIETTEVLTVGLQYAFAEGMDWVRKEDPLLALLLEHIFPKLEKA